MADILSREQHTPLLILDIGTRSVVGIAGHKEGDLFVVEAWARQEHPKRAMVDGQIEDIEQVARVAGAVKQRIEEQLNHRFASVSVAAAGRALKTRRAAAEAALPKMVPITAQAAFQIENDAINAARQQLEAEDADFAYTCVGHSVVRWQLDGYPFATVVGHRAAKAQVEIIATFLPAEVVLSLRRCMELLQLEIDTLTLEPIAAMRAVIPRDLRLLNLALADVGAGTSDIALSADGSVLGYTMATVAGDEVTEAILREYLVDFATAEALKLAMAEEGPHAFTDILGFEQQTDGERLRAVAQPALETLAATLAEKMVEANGAKPPAAVFLVGGGSKTPGLAGQLAAYLCLAENRVAPAGTQFSGKVLNADSGLDGPEFATPVGIALVAADNAEVQGAAVTVNGARVRLFAGGGTSVMDALLMGGYRYSSLMGRNGRSLTFTLNEQRTVVRGGLYTTAEITLNGRPAGLSAPVEDGDVIDLVEATSGTDASATVAGYAGGSVPLKVTLNGNSLHAGLVARINGTPVPPETPILERDAVELYRVDTVGALCAAAGLCTEEAELRANGEQADADTPLAQGMAVVCRPAGEAADEQQTTRMPADLPVEQLPAAPPDNEEMTGSTPPQPAPAGAGEPAPQAPPLPDLGVLQPQAPAKDAAPPVEVQAVAPAPAGRSLRVDLNGKTIVLPPKPAGEPHHLFDMLALVDIDPANPKGVVRILHNGKEAAYMDVLASGDKVDIGWDEIP